MTYHIGRAAGTFNDIGDILAQDAHSQPSDTREVCCMPIRQSPKLWYITTANLSDSASAAVVHSTADVRELRKLGWNALLLAQASKSPIPDGEAWKVVTCRYRRRVSRILYNSKVIARLVTSPRPEIVFFRGPVYKEILIALTLKILGIPFAVELNGLLPYRLCESKLGICFLIQRYCECFFMKNAAVLLPVTEQLKQLILSEKGPFTLIAVAPVGVDPDLHKPVLSRLEDQGNKLHLGFVGALFENRGLRRTMVLLHELGKAGVDADLTVVGDGPLLSELKSIAISLGIANKVRFVGKVSPERVGEATKDCDLMLALFNDNSRNRMMGLSPLKLWVYLSLAKPVVLQEHGLLNAAQAAKGIPGIFVVSNASSSNLVHMIEGIWRTYGRLGLRKLGQAGRDFVQQKATWRDHAKIIDVALKEALRLQDDL